MWTLCCPLNVNIYAPLLLSLIELFCAVERIGVEDEDGGVFN